MAKFLSFRHLFAEAPIQSGLAGNVGIGARSKELADLIFLSTASLTTGKVARSVGPRPDRRRACLRRAVKTIVIPADASTEEARLSGPLLLVLPP